MKGYRILIVEDEFLVAMELTDWLAKLGAEVIGPHGRLEPARKAAMTETLDGAILDIKLDGDRTYAVVAELQSRKIPVILATGFREADLPSALHHLPRLTKPYDRQAFDSMVRANFVRA